VYNTTTAWGVPLPTGGGAWGGGCPKSKNFLGGCCPKSKNFLGGCAPSPENFWIFVSKWWVVVHSGWYFFTVYVSVLHAKMTLLVFQN